MHSSVCSLRILWHAGGRFPGICAEALQKSLCLFSKWFSRSTKYREDTEITPMLMFLCAASATGEVTLLPSCPVPAAPHVHHPKANPSQVLELLLWLFSVHSAADPVWVLCITISHLCCGKSRGKITKQVFSALTAAGPLKIRSLDAQELTWCLLWQISI